MDRVELLDAKATRLAAIVESAGDARALAEALFTHAALSDLEGESVAESAEAARQLWGLMAYRPAATPLVRVAIHSAGLLPHAVIELVNDDMPFLVDSVTAELDRQGFEIERILHPILKVTRDAAGYVTAVGSGAKESVMRIDAGGRDLHVSAEALSTDLIRVLGDVRAAVTDWPAMRNRVRTCLAELAGSGPPVGLKQIDVDEVRAFLEWLDANNFTFLGYRAYRFIDQRMDVVPGSGLGLLRDDAVQVLEGARDLSSMPDEARLLLERRALVICTKAARKSTVHRRTHLDLIGIKSFDVHGKLVAEHRFAGLFTSHAYHASPFEIPMLRRKLATVQAQAGFDPGSHDGKALSHILETFPRDELFQIDADQLFDTAHGILELQERRTVAAFFRIDPFERFVSVLAYVPETRYGPTLRARFSAVLQDLFGGTGVDMHALLHNPPLVRMHLVVQVQRGRLAKVDPALLNARLNDLTRGWTEKLSEALTHSAHPEAGARLLRWANGFPTAYVESLSAEQAVIDIDLAEQAMSGGVPACALDAGSVPGRLGFRLALAGDPGSLSDILPMLERRGLRVLTEADYLLHPSGGPVVYLHAFDCVVTGFSAPDAVALAPALADSFVAGWTGACEEDPYNRLTLAAGLAWRDIALLRAYAKYLKQAGLPYTHPSIQDALVRNPATARHLVALFHMRFDPHRPRHIADKEADALATVILADLDAITALDEDRILRRLFDAIQNTLRTNFFVGEPARTEIALKLDSQKLDALPKPRPMVEIFICAPRVEAIHLRGGKVARGGIRWSDRRDDFRTEVLGLMKAQMVKNTVIVPVGSKGGFVVKKPPAPEAGRQALQDEVIACYKAMMHAMLDITDNRVGGDIIPPPHVVRRDGDDPYLVVAADKGTATFSDIANGVAEARGFWLGDAFASGGSAGYDHKGLGITARGAWVAVERHLREARIPLDGLRVIGVGDMSGDVFGNGLLHCDKLKLIAAFDHRHIFIDPDPDPALSFAERQRLFALKGSSWADYDATKISEGGGVFERKLKRIELTDTLRQTLAISDDREALTPAELIQAVLKAPADLLWFGGIGTYLKSSAESHADAGDRVNDSVRVDGRDVRSKIIGEGANLGVTQKARLEFAAKGGRIDTDAIHNSAGVDCSDHEVNLKILFGDALASGRLTRPARDELLAEMATEVCVHVLRDNALQTQALSMAERQGAALIDELRPLMRRLEQSAGLDRDLESLPSDAELVTRRNTGKGLLRPELAVVLGFVKLGLYAELLPAQIIDDPILEADLFGYFPVRLADSYGTEIRRHGLRRELIATALTNDIINRCGLTFVDALTRETGREAAAVLRAFVTMRGALELDLLWAALDAIDRTAEPAALSDALLLLAEALRRAAAWELRQPIAESVAARLAVLGPQLADLGRAVPVRNRAPAALGAELCAQIDRVLALAEGLDVLSLAAAANAPVGPAALVHTALLDGLCIPSLRAVIGSLPSNDRWMREAAIGLLDDLNEAHRHHASAVLREGGDPAAWLASRHSALEQIAHVVAELTAMQSPSLPRIVVASRLIRALA